jgi:hypothetical protein
VPEAGAGNRHPAALGGGDLEPREVHGAARVVAHQHREREAQVGDEREGMAGVHRQGREHRVDVLPEVAAERLPLPAVQLGPAEHRHPRFVAEPGAQEAAPGIGDGAVHLPRRAADQRELLAGGAPVQREGVHAGRLLPLQPADALLEELVQVRRRDGQEADPLQERDALVQRLGEHAPVEVQQPQLAVEVQRGVVELRARRHLLRADRTRELRPLRGGFGRHGRHGAQPRERGLRRRAGGNGTFFSAHEWRIRQVRCGCSTAVSRRSADAATACA